MFRTNKRRIRAENTNGNGSKGTGHMFMDLGLTLEPGTRSSLALSTERPPGVLEVMGSIPVGDSDFFLFHSRVMLSSSLSNNIFLDAWFCVIVKKQI